MALIGDLDGGGVLTALWLLRENSSTANDALWAWSRAGSTARGVRGAKMRTSAGLMDEFAAAWQFPHYFGENWAAFDECLCDMEWLLPAAGFTLLIYDAEQVLADDPADQLEILVRILGSAVDGYSREDGVGTAWERPAVPMRVVLQSTEEAVVVRRWTEAGASVLPWEG